MSAGTDSVTADFIRRHLDDDMEEVAQQPNQTFLHPSLSPFLSADGLLQLPPFGSEMQTVSFVLQVMSIKDVSLSREQRSRALVRAAGLQSNENGGGNSEATTGDDAASVANATLQAIEEQNNEAAQQSAPLRPSGGQWRCLRLELSDGFRRVLAVEDVSARTRQKYSNALFAPDGLALGSKVVVRLTSSLSRTAVQHGVLRLHAGNTEVLGGRVRALELFWGAQARQQLAASTGRPSRQQYRSPLLQDDNSNNRHAPITLVPPPPQLPQPPAIISSGNSASFSSPLPVQPLRQWPQHVAQRLPQTPFVTIAFITEVVSDMVINEPSASGSSSSSGFTYALLAQLSSPDAVEQETQQQPSSLLDGAATEVTEDDHLTVDLGHAWLRQLVGMPAEDFRSLSLSTAPADVARLTATVEAVGQALEQFGKGRFTLLQRAGDGIVEVVRAELER